MTERRREAILKYIRQRQHQDTKKIKIKTILKQLY
jgi:hypothetical protein